MSNKVVNSQKELEFLKKEVNFELKNSGWLETRYAVNIIASKVVFDFLGTNYRISLDAFGGNVLTAPCDNNWVFDTVEELVEQILFEVW